MRTITPTEKEARRLFEGIFTIPWGSASAASRKAMKALVYPLVQRAASHRREARRMRWRNSRGMLLALRKPSNAEPA